MAKQTRVKIIPPTKLQESKPLLPPWSPDGGVTGAKVEVLPVGDVEVDVVVVVSVVVDSFVVVVVSVVDEDFGVEVVMSLGSKPIEIF